MQAGLLPSHLIFLRLQLRQAKPYLRPLARLAAGLAVSGLAMLLSIQLRCIEPFKARVIEAGRGTINCFGQVAPTSTVVMAVQDDEGITEKEVSS